MNLLKILGSKIVDVIAPLLTPLVQGIVKDVLLAKLKEADEKAYKTVLASVYPAIDVYAETEAQKTATVIDDAVVKGFKLAFEAAAGADGVALPNLDDD